MHRAYLFFKITSKVNLFIKRESKTGLQASPCFTPTVHLMQSVNLDPHRTLTLTLLYMLLIQRYNFPLIPFFQKNRPEQFSIDRIKAFLKIYESNIHFAVQGKLFLYQSW